jgi:hypothetical protein
MTNTPLPPPLTHALDALRDVHTALQVAHVDTQTAAMLLSGARQARANELVEHLADNIAFCERLRFCVIGDARAEVGL